MKGRQFLAERYTADLEEYQAASPEEAATVNVSTGDLDCEVDWEFVDLTGDPDLSSRASIRFRYTCLREAYLVVCESI